MARPRNIRSPQTYRGPHSKIIWTADDQRHALRIGFFIGVRIEITERDPLGNCDKFERAKLNRLSSTLTKPMMLSMLEDGLKLKEAFWLKLRAFIDQQTKWGYVGAWEERARTFRGTKNAERDDIEKRIDRMHTSTKERAHAEAFTREYGRTLSSVQGDPYMRALKTQRNTH